MVTNAPVVPRVFGGRAGGLGKPASDQIERNQTESRIKKMAIADRDIVDHVIHTTLDAARGWRWCSEPLSMGSARAFVLQHILRNRFYSAVMRPAWMSRCPDLAIVRKTISQIRQELVYDDAIQAAHTKILWQLGRNIGLTDEQMDNVRPEPLVALFFSSLEDLARNWHWLVGWLASSIDEFIGGNLAGHNFHADNWMRDLGLSEEQVFFWRCHEKADLDHAGAAVWEPIRRHAASEAVQSEIEQGLVVALEAHRCAGLEIFFMAERGGAGFGPSRFWTTSLDSFSTAAALAAVTARVKLISTVHTAFFHPGIVARIGATLDQISRGRWGLNIVSGWAEKDFEMLGLPLREHDERYRLSTEFVEVLQKFWIEDWFDYRGRYFNIRQGTCEPKPLQRLGPPLYNAGSSPAGRDFAARYCDWYFTGAPTPAQVAEELVDMRRRAAAQGRRLRFISYIFVLCRDSDARAAEEVEEIMSLADLQGATEIFEAIAGQTLGTIRSTMGVGSEEEIVRRTVLGMGSGRLIGTPERVAEGLRDLQNAGLDGIGLTFRHVTEELDGFIRKVLPLLERMGVRQPRRAPG